MHPAGGVGRDRVAISKRTRVQHRDAQTRIESATHARTQPSRPGDVFCRLTQRVPEFHVKQHLLTDFWRQTTGKVSDAEER